MKHRVLGAAVAALMAGLPLQAASADTVGNSATDRGTTDGCGTCTFVVNQAFGGAGLTLSSYSFFASAEADITPLLLNRVNSGDIATFTVIGKGATRTSALGVNTFAFGLVDGTGVTAANSYFGFANTSGNNVTFSYFDPGEDRGTFLSSAIDVGDAFSEDYSTQQANAGFMSRTYSINATAVGFGAAIPEPATWAMMIGGFGAVGAGMRRRRREVLAAA